MKKNKKILLFFLILLVSVGFAFLTNNLNIFGSTILKGQRNLDIYFDNVVVLHGSEEYKPVITPTDKTEVTYNIRLDKPGDYYEFTVDVANGGDRDAYIKDVISKINDESVETALPIYLNYSITYEDNTSLKSNRFLGAQSRLTYKVRLTYSTDITRNQIPDTEQEINMSFSVDYVDADSFSNVTESTINKTVFNAFAKENWPTEIIFVGTGVSDSNNEKYVDISENQDGSIFTWMDGETMYVSAKEEGLYIKAPVDSSDLFGPRFGGGQWPRKIEKLDVSMLDTSNVTSMYCMFYEIGYSVDNFEIIGLENWDTSNVTDMSWMFYLLGDHASTWTIGDIGRWDTSQVTTMRNMFSNAGYFARSWSIGDISNWKTGNVTDMSNMFYFAGYNNATSWSIGDISGWDTSSVTNMSSMFGYTGYNADYYLDLSGWNVDKVTSYSGFNASTTTKVIPPVWVNS